MGEKSIMDGVYVFFILLEHHLYFFLYFYILEDHYFMGHSFITPILGFLDINFIIVNGNCIFRLCLTIWTNEFLGSNCNYKFIISFSMFNRMAHNYYCYRSLFTAYSIAYSP